MEMDEAAGNVWVSPSVAVTGGPAGGVPVVVAVFVNVPASISDCVSVYVAVKVLLSVAPGASDAIGPPTTVASGSEIVMLVRVVFPVFVTENT